MNFNEEAEALLNKQINIEVYASHVYLSTASYVLVFQEGLLPNI